MVIKSQNESYLMHTGDKGMKWGIRRWRNYDGSLTEAGKERYNYYEKRGQRGVARQLERNTYAPWDSRRGDSPVSSTISEAKNSTNEISKWLDAAEVGVRKKHLSGFSNKELQEKIERGRLESQYAQYYPTTIKTDTRKKLDKFLAVTAGVLTFGLGASRIYSKYNSQKLENIEKYDEAVKEAETKAKIKDFLGDVGNKKVSDIANMDSDTFNSIKSELKDRASAWKNVQTLAGNASDSEKMDKLVDELKDRM